MNMVVLVLGLLVGCVGNLCDAVSGACLTERRRKSNVCLLAQWLLV